MALITNSFWDFNQPMLYCPRIAGIFGHKLFLMRLQEQDAWGTPVINIQIYI